jgi:hypothetical protein
MTQAFDNSSIAASPNTWRLHPAWDSYNSYQELILMPPPRDTDPILPVANMAARPGEKKRVLIVGAGAAGKLQIYF